MFVFPRTAKRGQPLSVVPLLRWLTPFDHTCVWNILSISSTDFSSALSIYTAASQMSKKPLLVTMLASSLFSLWLLFCWRIFLMCALLFFLFISTCFPHPHILICSIFSQPALFLRFLYKISILSNFQDTYIIWTTNTWIEKEWKKKRETKIEFIFRLVLLFFCVGMCLFSFRMVARREKKEIQCAENREKI